MTNASRAQVDLDALARDLNHDTTRGSGKADPLAELARIVGQDDPFRALLQARDAQVAGRTRVEPSFGEAPAQPYAPQTYAQQPAPQAGSNADAFDQYLASVDHGAYRDPQEPYPDANAAEFAPNDADDRARPLERPRRG